MNHTLSRDAKDLLVEDFWRVIADTEALIKASAADGSADLAELRARVEASLAHVKTRLGNAQASLKASGDEAVGATQDYVRDNPWSALGLATGVGVVIGLMSGRH